MSDDTIKRADALNALLRMDGTKIDKALAMGEIRSIPSADRPQGEWLIEKTLYDNYNYRCSCCDWYECHAYPDVEPHNFCPNCGADMRGESDEQMD